MNPNFDLPSAWSRAVALGMRVPDIGVTHFLLSLSQTLSSKSTVEERPIVQTLVTEVLAI